mmetsp:Transcript_31681/g.51691  ORF Transcript_31681/g.51691 Transcript_31681/m.51691 type:complete len:173 (+) Transcript_31681:42-560(+)
MFKLLFIKLIKQDILRRKGILHFTPFFISILRGFVFIYNFQCDGVLECSECCEFFDEDLREGKGDLGVDPLLSFELFFRIPGNEEVDDLFLDTVVILSEAFDLEVLVVPLTINLSAKLSCETLRLMPADELTSDKPLADIVRQMLSLPSYMLFASTALSFILKASSLSSIPL